MQRRQFLQNSAAALALSAARPYAAYGAAKTRRVGLIGSGWYGKSDLFRLIQVSPVEVVSLCDVDSSMLADAADIVATRQALPQETAHLSRLPRDAARERPRHRPDRHARPLARPAHDRSRQIRRRCLLSRSPSASISWKARPCSPPPASTTASSRWARSAAAPRTSSKRATRSSRTGKLGKIAPGRDLLLLPHARHRQSAGYRAARQSRLRNVDRPCAHAPLQPVGSTRAAGAPSWNTATASSAICAFTCST